MSFLDFCRNLEGEDDQRIGFNNTFVITFTNKNGKTFSLDPSVVLSFLSFLQKSHATSYNAWNAIASRKPAYTQYEEKSYRAIFDSCKDVPGLNLISTLGGSQTRQLTAVISKLICYLGEFRYEGIQDNTRFDEDSVALAMTRVPENLEDLVDPNANSLHDQRPSSQEEAFRKWLKDEGLSEPTINKYAKDAPAFVDGLVGADNSDFPAFFSIRSAPHLERLSLWLENSAEWTGVNERGNGMYSSALKKYKKFLLLSESHRSLPKPFLLLAGVSGTGKTRFVRQQAEASRPDRSNFRLIPVRPDWHEPSDLLGYVTRIDGERFVPTPFLRFLVAAWCDAYAGADAHQIALRPLNEITTYWACLDEMNLAPVEQYFADYLAVLETREWDGDKYACDPLVHPASLLGATGSLPELQKALGLEGKDDLWGYFLANGIPLPPNLIVAGTVNMDETTHGFSRKVIDRAYTIDFGEFFPNCFDKFFSPDRAPKRLEFPRYSSVKQVDFADVPADPDGTKSVKFLEAINRELHGTPFELAFRALNELLIAVKCFAPADQSALEAVWDDFLMTKVLPRIEGDAEKLGSDGDKSLLTELKSEVEKQLPESVNSKSRPDLLQLDSAGAVVQVEVRSLKKITWMQQRLTNNAFTSFWP